MIIRGNTVGTPMPRTDFNQENPAKADYLKGRENLLDLIATAKAAGDNANTAAGNAQTAADNAQTAAGNAQTAADNALAVALSNNGHAEYTTVLEAAMAMPIAGGSFFAVANGTPLLNAADAPYPGQETTYFMLTDTSSYAHRRTVIAIPYGSGKTVKYRTIWQGAWQTDWMSIASPADIGAAIAFELTATIPVSGWFAIANSAYENDLDVAGVLGSDKVEVDVRMDDTSWEGIANNIQLEEEFAKIYQIPVSDGRLWIRAKELPTIDIPIKIKVVR